jgi:hypothetical protein
LFQSLHCQSISRPKLLTPPLPCWYGLKGQVCHCLANWIQLNPTWSSLPPVLTLCLL